MSEIRTGCSPIVETYALVARQRPAPLLIKSPLEDAAGYNKGKKPCPHDLDPFAASHFSR